MSASTDRASGVTTPTRDLGGLIIPVVLLGIGIFLVAGIVTMNEAGDGGLFGAKAFPWIVAVLCFAVSGLLAYQVLRPASTISADPGDEADLILDGDQEPPEASNWRSVATVVAGFVLFILLLQPIGWLISGTLLFAIVAFGLGARSHLTSIFGGLGMAAAVQLLFGGLLGIYVPPGILG